MTDYLQITKCIAHSLYNPITIDITPLPTKLHDSYFVTTLLTNIQKKDINRKSSLKLFRNVIKL